MWRCLALLWPELELCKTTGTSTTLPASSASGTEEGAGPWHSASAPPQPPYTTCRMAPLTSMAYLWDSLQPNSRQRGLLRWFLPVCLEFNRAGWWWSMCPLFFSLFSHSYKVHFSVLVLGNVSLSTVSFMAECMLFKIAHLLFWLAWFTGLRIWIRKRRELFLFLPSAFVKEKKTP